MGAEHSLWPHGGGLMGAMIRQYDWSGTALGTIEAWPDGLRTAVGVMLCSTARARQASPHPGASRRTCLA